MRACAVRPDSPPPGNTARQIVALEGMEFVLTEPGRLLPNGDAWRVSSPASVTITGW